MPELPEVETVIRGLRPVLTGRSFAAVDVLWDRTVACPDVGDFRRRLMSTHVQTIGRRGKYIVITLASEQSLLVHLRMSGRFVLHASEGSPGQDKHTRVRLQLDNGAWVLYVDPRKFGRFFLVDDPLDVVGDLGPEPLSAKFTPAWLEENLAGRRGEIKRLLLDQHFLAGLGNIYVSEALWQAQVHPLRVAGSLGQDEVTRLHAAIVSVLRQAIAQNGTSLSDGQYVPPNGQLGQYQNELCVYDREGEQCPRCTYALERIVQGQRSTYFCPVCQPSPASP